MTLHAAKQAAAAREERQHLEEGRNSMGARRKGEGDSNSQWSGSSKEEEEECGSEKTSSVEGSEVSWVQRSRAIGAGPPQAL